MTYRIRGEKVKVKITPLCTVTMHRVMVWSHFLQQVQFEHLASLARITAAHNSFPSGF